jgi:hypothetical protein
MSRARRTGDAAETPRRCTLAHDSAEIANYVTRRFGAAPSAITADDVAQLRREASQ